MDSPDDPPAGTGVSLFLYQVVENPYLKNQEFEQRGINTLINPPLVLDLLYLITPYSSAPGTGTTSVARENEQMLLTKILRVFHDNGKLSGPALGNALLDSGNRELRILQNILSMDQMNHLWSMFREASYKLCVSYTVTPLIIPSSREITTQRVLRKQLNLKDIEPAKRG